MDRISPKRRFTVLVAGGRRDLRPTWPRSAGSSPGPSCAPGNILLAVAGPRRFSAQLERRRAVRHGAGQSVAVCRAELAGGHGDSRVAFLVRRCARRLAHGRARLRDGRRAGQLVRSAGSARRSVAGGDPRAGERIYAVRDWILWQANNEWRWPNFNIADSLLVCGAAIMFFHALIASERAVERTVGQ